MGWLIDNMNALETYQNNAMARARQEVEDAYKQKQRGREDADYEEKQTLKTKIDAELDNLLKTTDGEYTAPDWDKEYGLTSKVPMVQPSMPATVEPTKPVQLAMAPQQANPSGQVAAAQVAPIAPVVPTTQAAPKVPATSQVQAAQDYALQAEESARADMRLSRMARDVNGFRAAQQQFNKIRQDRESASLMDFAVNAPADKVNEILKTITKDTTNGFEAVLDPQTNITSFKIGGVQADLSRYDLAKVLVAKNRMKKGDPTAINDIAAVNKDLAAKVAADMRLTFDVAKANNENVKDQRNFNQKVIHENAQTDIARQNSNTASNHYAAILENANSRNAGSNATMVHPDVDKQLNEYYTKNKETGEDRNGLDYASQLSDLIVQSKGGTPRNLANNVILQDQKIAEKIDNQIAAGTLKTEDRQKAINSARNQAIAALRTPAAKQPLSPTTIQTPANQTANRTSVPQDVPGTKNYTGNDIRLILQQELRKNKSLIDEAIQYSNDPNIPVKLRQEYQALVSRYGNDRIAIQKELSRLPVNLQVGGMTNGN